MNIEYMKKRIIIIPAFLACLSTSGFAQEPDKNIKDSVKYAVETIDVGANRTFTRAESAASVSTVYNEQFDKRASKNISNSLYGHGLGLIALQNSGNYSDYEPTFYVRGLQSLSSSSPLILVDGLERDMSLVSPEEVESVSVLKDAAAVALYGYKAINGAILITTKRGKYNTREVNFTYDHVINWEVRRPKFANALMYANAMNEAYANDGLGTRYNDWELNAFATGQQNVNLYPAGDMGIYANVDWLGETFRDQGVTNKYMVEFRGGGSKFRYYTLVNLLTDKGFIKNPNENEGYSTQNKYSRANLRTNLDADLTPTTKLKLNVLGTLSELSRPGNSADLWNMVYTLPSTAFPIRQPDGTWSGGGTWDGTLNPVAQSQGASYSKGHSRSLFADLTLSQNLSSILPGLGANIRLAYDNYSSLWEDHSKTYVFNSYSITGWESGEPANYHHDSGGTNTEMGTSSEVKAWTRQFNFAGSIDYGHSFGRHDIYSQLKWDYEYRDATGINTTIYRQNVSWYTHYGLNKRYYIDLALVGSASSLLQPGHKWAFSPTVAAAWVLSEENFLKDIPWIDFLKLRASFGIINADYLPKDGSSTVYDYWDEIYNVSGVTYPFDDAYGTDFGSTSFSRLVSQNTTHEKAFKYNVGLDATLFKGLNLTAEGYYQKRKDIWVSSSGKYSSVLGMAAPFENAGRVDSWGAEAGIDYTRKFGEVVVNAGGNFSFNRNEIKEQLEEPRAYENLKQTGHPLNQTYGLIAEGFFKDEAEIAEALPQNFSTVRPGDIKYKDMNGDKKIDENDVTAIGYSTVAPEIYYSFHLGLEWKGLGFDAMFQGTGHYSAMLNTKSLFWPLVGNTTISEHYYENRWTPENPDAKYPRLSAQSNTNNYQNNTIWLADRSFLKLRNVELYYKFPKAWMKRTKFLGNAKIYVRGVDLLCFDKIDIADPESYGATNPLTRSVVAGLTIGF